MSLPPFRTVPDSGPLPRRALPRVSGTTDPSATLPARPAPRGVPVAACMAPSGLPVLLRFPPSMHADAITPAETSRCARRSLPSGRRPSPNYRRVGSALTVSGPARRSLAFRPAWSLSRPRRPFYQSASAHVVTSMNRPGRYQPERQLLGGFRTHQEARLSTAHCKSDFTFCQPELTSNSMVDDAMTIPHLRSTASRTVFWYASSSVNPPANQRRMNIFPWYPPPPPTS